VSRHAFTTDKTSHLTCSEIHSGSSEIVLMQQNMSISPFPRLVVTQTRVFALAPHTLRWCQLTHTPNKLALSFTAWPSNYSDQASLGKTGLTMCAFMKRLILISDGLQPPTHTHTHTQLSLAISGVRHAYTLIRNTGESLHTHRLCVLWDSFIW